MKRYEFSPENDCHIRAAIEKLRKEFYYGRDCITIKDLTFATTPIYTQIYIVVIKGLAGGDTIHILPKSDDSGEIDCVRIFDGTNTDKLMNIIRTTHSFWGLNVDVDNIIEQVLSEMGTLRKYYQLNIIKTTFNCELEGINKSASLGAPIGNYINEQGNQLIDNVYNGLKSHPFYSKYDIQKGFDGSTYIIISHYGEMINRFSFYGTMGEINSIAIYGLNLRGHMRAIQSSGEIFGLSVEEVCWEGDFIDVFLNNE